MPNTSFVRASLAYYITSISILNSLFSYQFFSSSKPPCPLDAARCGLLVVPYLRAELPCPSFSGRPPTAPQTPSVWRLALFPGEWSDTRGTWSICFLRGRSRRGPCTREISRPPRDSCWQAWNCTVPSDGHWFQRSSHTLAGTWWQIYKQKFSFTSQSK